LYIAWFRGNRRSNAPSDRSKSNSMRNEWQECLRPDADDEATNLCISLNVRGDIAINAGTWQKLGRPWFVVLLYDPARRLIGLKPVKPGSTNAFRVRTHGARGARVVCASRLLKQFGIRLGQTVRFARPRLAGGIWELDLTSATVTGRRQPDSQRKLIHPQAEA
jgi:hypothetical protein